MTHQYQLHPRLAEDTVAVDNLELCEVRLLNDSRFPWLILIPRKAGISEVYQLDRADQKQLILESSLVSEILKEVVSADKINVGALGNLVPQLHWHVVARSKSDACWPGPAWGCGKSVAYQNKTMQQLVVRLGGAIRNSSE
ncbi:MAG: HIT family protein [Chromatiales bacterium]|jgi:diadenosine tetraphosphate (Ap4A) HIT family hydrolase